MIFGYGTTLAVLGRETQRGSNDFVTNTVWWKPHEQRHVESEGTAPELQMPICDKLTVHRVCYSRLTQYFKTRY